MRTMLGINRNMQTKTDVNLNQLSEPSHWFSGVAHSRGLTNLVEVLVI